MVVGKTIKHSYIDQVLLLVFFLNVTVYFTTVQGEMFYSFRHLRDELAGMLRVSQTSPEDWRLF